ncbi:AlpA family transcriptional regulator [Tateyamaria sp. Alg231-49]|uniref:helix-turn-helix transcriptional regulator n=1 Tax=Tateyamaria sp. Alg231-49 TaxID=1922219 RepID=UPI0018FFC316|nr:helix-turn-helix domain-containing protein [Tateyamaria sp. Alg231-49]
MTAAANMNTNLEDVFRQLDRRLSPEHRFADALVQMERDLSAIPMRIDDDALYSTKQTAARLSISHRTLEGWRSRGKGPKVTKLLDNSGVRYRGKHIREFIEACEAWA